MPVSKLLQLVKDEDFEGFESLCLEALENGTLRLAEIVGPFEALEKHGHADRATAIGQMVLENADAKADSASSLRIARVAMLGDPKNDELRKRLVELYREVHGETPGFVQLLDMSGLTSGRPVRNAIRVLDACLTLKPGDALISRTEDVVVEVKELDLAHALVTLKHPRRVKTVTPVELSREYDPIAPDDFRALRALHPEQVSELLKSDPVAVVIGLIHAHGEMINQDMLKRELVPKYIDAKEWSKWWTKARNKLKRCPHVIIEGRNPVILSYTAEVFTLEDETWEKFRKLAEPADALLTVERYIREKKSHKEEPDVEFLKRCHDHLDSYRATIERLRPSEALGCALVGARIDELAGGDLNGSAELARQILRESEDPAALITRLEGETLWTRALAALAEARPGDAALHAAALIPTASANVLDQLVSMARKGESLEMAQSHIDTALADPVDYPEIIYWIWKGPKKTDGLRLPSDDQLFSDLIRTLRALGRTLNPDPEITKKFRLRIRTALALRGYARAAECIGRIAADRAITLRTQLRRLEGVGDNVRDRLQALLRGVHPSVFVVHQRRRDPWEDPDVLWNTEAGIQRKTRDRDELVNVKMRENAKRIGEAASHGDLSENSEYKFALEERDFLRARLAQMNNDLSLAQQLDPYRIPTEHVGVGSRVRLRDTADGSTRTMTFFGPFDTDVDQGIYNYKAPFCQELMGLKIGDRKRLMLDNREIEFEVLEIANGLAAETTA